MNLLANKQKRSLGVWRWLLVIFLCVLLLFGIEKIIFGLFPFEYTEYIDRYAAEFNLDRHLVMGLIKTESNFNADAISKSGAKGLMQMTDATAGDCAEKLGFSNWSEERIFDPETNIYMGCYYLSYLRERFGGETETALAAYNAGEGNVREWLSDSQYSADGISLHTIPYPETASYIKKIRLYTNIYELLEKWLNK